MRSAHFRVGALRRTRARPAPRRADIALSNAWMRPAPAGASSAKVYVDITSDAPLELVGRVNTRRAQDRDSCGS